MQRVEKVLERVSELPFSPVVIKILELAQEDRAGAREIAKLIAQDQAFTARLLKIANSPYYGQTRPVTTVAQAVPVLGFDTISSLALALNSFAFNLPDDGAVLTLRDLWEHSMSCACWARQIAKHVNHPMPEEAFVAGLLHDMGQALFYRYFKAEFLEAVMKAWSENISLLETERSVFGIDHQVAGAVAAGRWHIPSVLIHAIEHHHHPLALPDNVDAYVLRTVAIVHVADLSTQGSPVGRGVEENGLAVAAEVWDLLQLQQEECQELSDGVMAEIDEFRKIINVGSNAKESPNRRQGRRPADHAAQPWGKKPSVQNAAKPSAGFSQGAALLEDFARIMDASKQMSLLAGMEDLYPNIALEAMALLHADAAHLFLPRDKSLKVVGAAGLTGLKGKRTPTERSLTGWVFRMGETMVLPHIDKAAASWEKEFFKAVGFHSHLFLPVDWAGERLGVLTLHARAARSWTAREIALGNAFAGLVAMALENARLYRAADDRAKTLEDLNRKLEAALQVKSRFLSTVSHELRSPLFVINGYASLIAEQMFGPLPPEMSQAADKILHQANGLIALINNILEISQLDAGTFTCQPEPFDLKVLLDELSRKMPALIGEQPVAFETRYGEEPFPIVTDRERFAQVLGHVLDNAAKFTQQGKIVLGAAAVAGGVEIVIEDSGIGIDAEYQKIIFDRFRQAEEEDNRRFEGMGLGLYLSRRLIELLGGKISVESELGKGSLFRLWLPRGEIGLTAVGGR